jgi:hypothetical protein
MARMVLLITTTIGIDTITAGSVIDSVLEAELYTDLLAADCQLLPYVGDVAAASDKANSAKKKGASSEVLDSIMLSVASIQAMTADHVAYDDTVTPAFGHTDVQSAFDHVKGVIPARGTTTPLAVAATGDAGTSTSYSSKDHAHAHGNQASSGSLHAVAIAGGAAGFLSGTDKTKLDGLGNNAIQDIFYVGPTGSDTTGNGTEDNPFLTLQKCYDTWFPTGTPTTWAEFDRKRVIRVLPGTKAAGAGNLAASCCNLVIMGCGTIGNVTYDVKSEVMATFTGASTNYEANTLHFYGGGFGYNSSSADAQLITGDVTVSNYNVAARELSVAVANCQTQMKTQCRSGIPGGSSGTIYVYAHDTMFIYCESGVNALGNAPMTFSMCHDCIFRNQVNATKGAIGFADLQGCYFRRGFVGDPGIGSMLGTGVFRGWEDNHIKYAFDVTAAGAQVLWMDYPTWKYIQEQASPVWGTTSVKLTDMTYGVTGSRPTAGLPTGVFYFDTALAAGAGKPIWWNGTAWVDATGTSV